jgi:hypothetical protein
MDTSMFQPTPFQYGSGKTASPEIESPRALEITIPFTMMIVGPSGSGKTVFSNMFMDSELLRGKFNKIIWCYSEAGSLGETRRDGVIYNEGLPAESLYDGKPTLVVLDDLMHETNEGVAKLFTRISHHRNVSVIYLTQNLFSRNKNQRDLSLNTHFLVLMKTVRGKEQVVCFSRRVSPENPKFFIDAFAIATSVPHGYLFCDFRQRTPELQRYMTDIFNKHPVVFIPSGTH